MFIFIFIAFVSGILVVFSMISNAKLGQKIGIIHSTLTNYIVGSLFAFIVVLFAGGLGNLTPSRLTHIPLWAYAGGLLGVCVVVLSNIIIPHIPTVYSALLIFLGQLTMGIIVDIYVGNSFSYGKLVGGIMIAVGLIYIGCVDNKKKARM